MLSWRQWKVQAPIDGVLDVLYPRQCLATGALVDADSPFRYLCTAAARQLVPAKAPFCPTCGHPFWGAANADQVCPHCRELDPVFGEGRTLALMRDPARILLIELKYHGGFFVLPDVQALARQVPGYLDYLAGAVLVPVPLHRSKLRRRGFNQSRLLAEWLAAVAEGCTVRDLLVRTRPTPSQTRLPRKDRQENVEGAFAEHPRARIDPKRRHVLVDDVFTTGATLNACARVLRQAGIPRVDVATICHG